MTSTARGFAVLFSTCLLVAASASSALAAGYDTPVLYSARHMGMGGTAIGFVNDPSAIFHNPAGIGHVKKASALVDISFLTGHLITHPSADEENLEDVQSEPVVAPFFLIGGAFRINDWMSAGFGVYPLASAGGAYKYNNVLSTGADPVPIDDSSKLVMIEASPALAFTLPGNLSLGVGYRLGYVTLDRNKSRVDTEETLLGLSASGLDATGYRVGLQWKPMEALQVGLVYRSEVEVAMTGEANSGPLDIPEVDTSLLLAPKIGAGIRYDHANFGAAFDVEYTWTSHDKVQAIVGSTYMDIDGESTKIGEVTLNNVLLWEDALTIRGGLEGRFANHYAARLGYVYDGKVGNETFPSGFGTPPTPTHSFTYGLGYSPGPWAVNLAYAFRMGNVTITPSDVEGADAALLDAFGTTPDDDGEPVQNIAKCDTCASPGAYEIRLHGIYIDFSYEWGTDDEAATEVASR